MAGLRPHVFPISLQVLFFVLRTRFASLSFIHAITLPVLRRLRGVLSLPFLVNHIRLIVFALPCVPLRNYYHHPHCTKPSMVAMVMRTTVI